MLRFATIGSGWITDEYIHGAKDSGLWELTAVYSRDKARGEAKTYQALTALMRDSKDCTGAEVIVCHCENLPGALKLKEQILKDLPVKSVELVPCRGLTSFYAMEKGLIIGY